MIRLLVAALLATGLAIPQEPAAPQETEEEFDQVFRAIVQEVVVPTIVTDRHGNYVDGLQAHDFRVTDNGKLQDVKVDVAFVPISLVVAIQANASAEPVLPKVRQIASLLQGLVVGEKGEVAVIAFDHRIQVLQDFTRDGDRIAEALNQLKPGSSSSRMTDAVVEASRMLRKRPREHRRVLLLISETRDGGSAARPRQALTDLQFDNVSVYSVNISRLVTTLLAKPQPPRPDPIPHTARPIPAGVPQTPSSAAQLYGHPGNSANFIPAIVEIFKATKGIFVDNPVEVFTRWTGGREHSFMSQRDLESAIARIGEELHAGYLITYVPNNKDEGGYHEIEVTIANRPELKARTRPGYWVAAQPSP